MDFAITCSLVRPGRPRYPVLVHRAASLLHASFRPHLAVTPLRFANPSPPSGWVKDFHLQAVDHARHTEKSHPEGWPSNLVLIYQHFVWLRGRATANTDIRFRSRFNCCRLRGCATISNCCEIFAANRDAVGAKPLPPPAMPEATNIELASSSET
jgi:hypothetical protein